MRTLAVWVTLLVALPLTADDASDSAAKQKTAIADAWKALQLPAAAPVESANLIVVGTLPDARIKALSATLEKQYSAAVQGLKFEGGDKPIPGKLAAYVFDDGTKYRSFVRTVVKASPDDDEQGRQSVTGDTPFIAAGPGRTKDAPSPETQAGIQVAVALLAARTKNAPLPEWATLGFAKATAFQASGAGGATRKKSARDIAKRARVRDLWGETLSGEQKAALGTGVMDFLIYGKGVTKPIDVIAALRPEEDKPVKTAADVFGVANMTPDQFEAAYVRWLARN